MNCPSKKSSLGCDKWYSSTLLLLSFPLDFLLLLSSSSSSSLPRQRVGFVQQRAQYVFCYKAIREYLLGENAMESRPPSEDEGEQKEKEKGEKGEKGVKVEKKIKKKSSSSKIRNSPPMAKD